MSGLYVRVRVGAETYALSVEHVLEVSDLGEVAAVPGAPASALGVRNLRGQVLPVFDLASVLGLSSQSPPARLLVAEGPEHVVGLAIDDVTDVGPLPTERQEADSELLSGSTLEDGVLVGVIDVPRLFEVLNEAAR